MARAIYIPIWWYSNDYIENVTYVGKISFTFQSGDIQIRAWLRPSVTALRYLHSNLVIFKFSYYKTIPKTFFYLHSNLVIFKFTAIKGNTTKTYTFTFQSGDIQIYSVITLHIFIFINLHSNLVIFKCV